MLTSIILANTLNLPLVDWLFILAGILCGTIPLGVVVRNYLRIRSKDYLILAGFFLMGSLSMFSEPLSCITGNLLIWVIGVNCYFLMHFCVFLHVVRLRWEKSPPAVWIVSIFFLLVLQLEIIFRTFLIEITNGPILTIEVFRFLVGLLLLYCYISIVPVKPSDRIMAVKKWITIASMINIVPGIFSIIYGLLALINPNLFSLELVDIVFFSVIALGGMIFIYVALRYPECLLISQVQLLRAKELYKKVQNIPIEQLDQDALITYLSTIPAEIFEELN
ncbi:MAG: hypothetical protein ACFFC7_11540 [Candidatus Hermodarchaeota archaeon]